MLPLPTLATVTAPPPMAANASGYVAEDASPSTAISAGFAYTPRGTQY